MTLDKAGAREIVATNSKLYLAAQNEVERQHQGLKDAIKRAKHEGRLTQQEIADATVVEGDDVRFDLSRQRIGQILNEE